jgi:hypothetical protein
VPTKKNNKTIYFLCSGKIVAKNSEIEKDKVREREKKNKRMRENSEREKSR